MKKRVSLARCKFRWRPWALRYGWPDEYGIRYEWLGLSLRVGTRRTS